MKKIAKLSLVAAVAVVGFTSANAQSLEEAIKGVETSGSVVYRYNDYNNDNGESATSNNYKVALNLASKVNEDVKLNTRFIVGGADSGFASLNTQSTSDSNVDVTLSNVYFGYTGLQNTTVNVGKQGLTTPWTVAVDSDGNEQTGTGVLALTTIENVTLAAAYFNQTDLGTSGDFASSLNNLTSSKATKVLREADDDATGSKSIATVGAIATLGPVTLDAWYLDMNDTFDSYTGGAKANFEVADAKIGVDARYASLSIDNVSNDNSMGKIALTGKLGIVNAKVLYAMTDKDGGLTALDNDAVTTALGWNTTINGKADADYWQTTLGVDILSNLNLSANYNNLQYVNGTADIEEEELYAQLTYKMSKNFSTYGRFGTYTNDKLNTTTNKDTNDDVRGRVQVEYTF